MKRTLLKLLTLLCCGLGATAAFAGSAILLEGGEVKPAGILNISLDPLLKNVQYTLSCQVSNQSAVPVDLGFDFSGGGLSTDFSLNNVVLENGQASLSKPENTLEVMVSSAQSGNAVLIKNLDFKQAVQVNNCVATPKVKTLEAKGRFIAVSNESAKPLQLSFANSQPSLYTLAPHAKRFIYIASTSRELSIQSPSDQA